ncbi:MAG: threonine-phosphate decarboxylase, partial [Lachnospiraceae bacterium]|nr:threonine-phosphate decarboxylase [Lachnospiraceae bacterium]
MSHGGDIYRNKVDMDYSVNLNPLGTPQEIKDALVNSLCRSAEYPDSEQSLVRSIAARAEGLLP